MDVEEFVAWARLRGTEERKHAENRREMARVSRGGTQAEWSEAALMATRQSGREVPASTPAERKRDAEIQDRIAAKHDAEAERFEQVADILARREAVESAKEFERGAEEVCQELLDVLRGAWPELPSYGHSPTELVTRLINERDEAREVGGELLKEKIEGTVNPWRATKAVEGEHEIRTHGCSFIHTPRSATITSMERTATARTASDTEWLTPATAAAVVQVGRRRIYSEVRRGTLKAARIGGRREIRINREWLAAWLNSLAGVSGSMPR